MALTLGKRSMYSGQAKKKAAVLLGHFRAVSDHTCAAGLFLLEKHLGTVASWWHKTGNTSSPGATGTCLYLGQGKSELMEIPNTLTLCYREPSRVVCAYLSFPNRKEEENLKKKKKIKLLALRMCILLERYK